MNCVESFFRNAKLQLLYLHNFEKINDNSVISECKFKYTPKKIMSGFDLCGHP